MYYFHQWNRKRRKALRNVEIEYDTFAWPMSFTANQPITYQVSSDYRFRHIDAQGSGTNITLEQLPQQLYYIRVGNKTYVYGEEFSTTPIYTGPIPGFQYAGVEYVSVWSPPLIGFHTPLPITAEGEFELSDDGITGLGWLTGTHTAYPGQYFRVRMTASQTQDETISNNVTVGNVTFPRTVRTHVTFVPDVVRTASTNDTTVIHSGHSLTDGYVHYGPWPGSFRRLAESIGITNAEEKHIKSTTPGSWIRARYEHDDTYNDEPERAFADIDLYDTLMITEAGPPPHYVEDRAFLITETLDYLCRFAANTIENGKSDELILWSIWPDLRGPGYPDTYAGWTGRTFEESLEDYGLTYKFMADYVGWKMKQLYPHLPSDYRVWIFPGHLWMQQILTDLDSDYIPGMTTIEDFFEDEIHPNPIAVYGLACMVISCMYQINLEHQGSGVYIMPAHTASNGVSWPAVSQELAEYFWGIGYQIATTYEPAGLGGFIDADPVWTLEDDGDLMPHWTLANPVTGSLPSDPEEPTLPDDLLGTVTASGATGLTFTPALPEPVDGFRTLVEQHSAPATNVLYACARFRRNAPGGPIFTGLGTNNNTWSGSLFIGACNGPWDNFTAVLRHPPSSEELIRLNGTYLDFEPRIQEIWYDSGTIYSCVDGGDIYSLDVVEPPSSAFAHLFVNVEGYGYDLNGLAVMDRVPSEGERAGIRAMLVQ